MFVRLSLFATFALLFFFPVVTQAYDYVVAPYSQISSTTFRFYVPSGYTAGEGSQINTGFKFPNNLQLGVPSTTTNPYTLGSVGGSTTASSLDIIPRLQQVGSSGRCDTDWDSSLQNNGSTFFDCRFTVPVADGTYYWFFYSPNNEQGSVYWVYPNIFVNGGVITSSSTVQINRTGIISIAPTGGVTINATSTNDFTVEWLVSEDDYREGSYVQFEVIRQASVQQVDKTQAWEDITNTASTTDKFQVRIPITASGFIQSETYSIDTSDWRTGRYTIVAEIVIPDLPDDTGFFAGLWGSLVNLTERFVGGYDEVENTEYRLAGEFVLGSLTSYDILHDQVSSELTDLDDCNFTDIIADSSASGLLSCVRALVFPSEA